jgi:alkylation response protein AidB-like acyl-CoA dehydrogenase
VLRGGPGGARVHGEAGFVPDAPDADELLLFALDADGATVVLHVPADRPGIRITTQALLDATRSVGVVSADGVDVHDASVWRFAGDADAAVRGVFTRGAVAVACDSLGLSRAMLDATVAYAGVRTQFGRPIGSFQAVKHACADMFVQIAVSEQLVGAAVEALVGGDPEAWVAASRAKSHVGAAAVDVVGKALQLHGGIGYTWESGIHVYLKRATLDRSLLGSPLAHRRRLAARLVPRGDDGAR